jgi:hypothetical protein
MEWNLFALLINLLINDEADELPSRKSDMAKSSQWETSHGVKKKLSDLSVFPSWSNRAS